jgi:Holliday junction resolvase
MASTPEGKVKTRVKRILDEYGVYHFSPATGGYGRSGVPDIVCCYKGYFFAIECKAGGNTTTALQDREIDRIKKAGGLVWVVNEDNTDSVRNLLKGIDYVV